MVDISNHTNVKKVCVSKRGNAYYYPKTIPRVRQSMTNIFLLIVIVLITVEILTSSKTTSQILSCCVFSYLYFCVFVLIYRTVLYIAERKHLLSRYAGKNKDLLRAAYSFPLDVISFTVVVLIYAVYFCSAYGLNSVKDWNCYYVLPVLFFLNKVFDMDSNPINDSLWIEKCNGLDYGSGLAYSFYYGYLYYILPKTGDQMKNLHELMQDYESTNKVKFDVYKIFILIPKSLLCHVSLADVSKIMEMKKSLDPKYKTVAGVDKRVYKNSVYGIKHERTGKTCYVCAEYATPLQTASLIFTNSTPHTEYYKRHKNDILLQFYLTLKEILKDTKFDSMCELVYYEDMDEDGKYYDVGKILLNRIVELKKEERGIY